MERVNKIIVAIQFLEKEIEVGELVANNNAIFFKYYPSFLKNNLEISPFKLPLKEGLIKAEPYLFNGLFGVFNDSLPDGWGQLLLDRKLFSKGILPQDVGPLDRLAYVGSKGMGALVYHPEIISENNTKHLLALDVLEKEIKEVYEGSSIEVVEQLFSLGGSSGGARPKILVGYNKNTEKLIHGVEEIPLDYEHWIIKFQARTDFSDMAHVEYAYYKMALDAGIKMSESQLFFGKSGKAYFGTKRFDRVGRSRLHMMSVSALLDDDYRRSTLDYGHIMDAAFQLKKDVRVYEEVLRIAAFNVFSHNRDDHSKNFSFLMNKKGDWDLTPAYDLTFSSSSHGMHSTMVASESENPGTYHLMELGRAFGIKNASKIIEEVKLICSNWKQYAKDAGVKKVTSNFISKRINQLIKN